MGFVAFLNQLVRAYPARVAARRAGQLFNAPDPGGDALAAAPSTRALPFHTGQRVLDELVEIWFSILTEQQIRRGVYHGVPELIAAIEHFVNGYNKRAQLFVWTKTPGQVLAKASKQQDTSETLQ